MSIRRASSVTFVSRVVTVVVTVRCRQFVVSSSSCLPSVGCRKRVFRSCQDPRCDALFQRPYVSTVIRSSFRSVSTIYHRGVTLYHRNDRKDRNPLLSTSSPRLFGYDSGALRRARTFGSGTEAFGFAAPSSLGCRVLHTLWSAPRISIRLSAPTIVTTFYCRAVTYPASTTN